VGSAALFWVFFGVCGWVLMDCGSGLYVIGFSTTLAPFLSVGYWDMGDRGTKQQDSRACERIRNKQKKMIKSKQ